jgi:hypothetical protein
MLFHSWQESQRPGQRLVIAPQFWQTKVERDLAMGAQQHQWRKLVEVRRRLQAGFEGGGVQRHPLSQPILNLRSFQEAGPYIEREC